MATLLLIESSPTERAALRGLVEKAGLFSRVLEADGGLAGIKALLSESVDVILTDLEMPGADGAKVLGIRNSLPGAGHMPLIFLAATQDYARNARLLGEGASDIIMKPIHADDVLARLRVQIKVMRLQRKLSKKVELLEHLSTTDPLTGLRNQAHLSEVLSVEFERAQRYQMKLSVVLADVDNLKEIAASRGREYTDAALQGIGELLRQNLRRSDVGGRYDADQFMAILAHTPAEGAATFATRWKESVELEWGPGVAFSVGVATHGEGCDSPGALIGSAHAALCEAKGRTA